MGERRDLSWCTPNRLPAELRALSCAVPDGLSVGAAGKTGVLDLELAPQAGLTRVVRQYQRAPLYVYRPIHLDPVLPEMAFIFVQQQGDGLVRGDRYRMDIDCAPRSAVHVTTQAATKVFAAGGNFATQWVNLTVGEEAVLEYLPDPVVPFRGSRLFQRTCLTIAPSATAILGEILLPGRVAHGEAHAYDFYWAETTCHRPDGRLLFADTLRSQPGASCDPRSPAVLGGYDVLATLYCVCSRVPTTPLITRLRATLAQRREVFGGVSELPGAAGAVVRILGHHSKTVQAVMRELWEAARTELLGAPAPDLRKG